MRGPTAMGCVCVQAPSELQPVRSECSSLVHLIAQKQSVRAHANSQVVLNQIQNAKKKVRTHSPKYAGGHLVM